MIRMLRLSRGIVWGDSLLTQLPTQDVTSTPTRGETIAHDEGDTTMTDECAMYPPAGKDGHDAAHLPHYKDIRAEHRRIGSKGVECTDWH